MQKIYNYDKEGFYTAEGYANPNPRIKGEYLIPANATTIKVPELTENQKARFNKIKNKWEIYTITAKSKDVVIDEELKVIRDMNLEEQIEKGVVNLLETQKLNDDKTEIIDKNYTELIADNVLTLDEAKLELILKLKKNLENKRIYGVDIILDDVVYFQKCRETDSSDLEGILSGMSSTNETTYEGYNLFKRDELFPIVVNLTYNQILNIKNSGFEYLKQVYLEFNEVMELIKIADADDLDALDLTLKTELSVNITIVG